MTRPHRESAAGDVFLFMSEAAPELGRLMVRCESCWDGATMHGALKQVLAASDIKRKTPPDEPVFGS
jgi:hypothetical protein